MHARLIPSPEGKEIGSDFSVIQICEVSLNFAAKQASRRMLFLHPACLEAKSIYRSDPETKASSLGMIQETLIGAGHILL